MTERRQFIRDARHESLADATLAALSTRSPRPYASRLPPVEYPPHFEVRLVSTNGGIRWLKGWGNVSHLLAAEYVGFEMQLGRSHEPLPRIEEAHGRLGWKRV